MTNKDELRSKIHLEMLSKSKSAKDCGELTVVPLGFAVDVALNLLEGEKQKAEQIGRLSQQHDEWLRARGTDPEYDSCDFCMGEAHSLDHDIFTDKIATLNKEPNKEKGQE